AGPRVAGLHEVPAPDRGLPDAFRGAKPPPQGRTLSVRDVDADLLYQPGRPRAQRFAPGEARARQGGAAAAPRAVATVLAPAGTIAREVAQGLSAAAGPVAAVDRGTLCAAGGPLPFRPLSLNN